MFSRLLTRITSGMALTSGCMPPSSKSIQPLKMTARSGQSGWSPALIQLTVLHTVSLGSCATLTTVACGSESRACPSPLGINSASPLSRVNCSPLAAQQHRPAADEMELGFTRHGAKADAERACGFDAPVVNAGEAHTAQQFAGQVDGRLAHGNSGRIINN